MRKFYSKGILTTMMKFLKTFLKTDFEKIGVFIARTQ